MINDRFLPPGRNQRISFPSSKEYAGRFLFGGISKHFSFGEISDNVFRRKNQ
jgi:hypothetical protein